MKKRHNSAERLRDVLELVHARCRNGLLSVERFEGGRFEEGEIYFEQGQPVYARQGHKTGKEALSRLIRWNQVYFAFDIDAPNPAVQSLPKTRSSQSQSYWTYLPSPENTSISALPEARLIQHIPLAQIEQLIPRKLVLRPDVLALPLTRLQRSIYLLVDGKRTVADLARCIGRSIHDIRQLLIELEGQGLVSI